MSKKILIISASLRNKSNSEALAESFKQGAEAAGHEVEIISLKGKQISFCKGCFACQKTGRCVIKDDAIAIYEAMQKAEVLVFAGPVYYYGLSGQLKTMLDRANPLFPQEYAFRDVYLLATAAEAEEHAVHGSKVGVQGWVDCFEKASFKGTVFAGGVNLAGEIEGHKALQEAYNLGERV